MMKTNNRTCVVTQNSYPKSELIRLVRTKAGKILVNSNEKGRGVYVLNSISILDKLTKQKILHKIFRENISEAIYKELDMIIRR